MAVVKKVAVLASSCLTHLACRYEPQMELLKRQLEPFENMHHWLAAAYIEVGCCTCQPLPCS